MSWFILSFHGDVTDCKDTEEGWAYTGQQNNGGRCLFWKDADVSWPVAKFENKDFPDGSVDAAQNYCRNPRDPDNPSVKKGKFHTLWCYVSEGKNQVRAEECEKPKLCGEFQPKKVFSSSYSYSSNF